MLLNDLKKAALCVAAGFAVTMFGGCDSQKSTGALAGAGAQRAPQVSVTEIQPTELDMTTTLQGRTASYLVADVRPQVAGILQKRLFKEGSEVKEDKRFIRLIRLSMKPQWQALKPSFRELRPCCIRPV